MIPMRVGTFLRRLDKAVFESPRGSESTATAHQPRGSTARPKAGQLTQRLRQLDNRVLGEPMSREQSLLWMRSMRVRPSVKLAWAAVGLLGLAVLELAHTIDVGLFRVLLTFVLAALAARLSILARRKDL
jgi:hypothetical protein